VLALESDLTEECDDDESQLKEDMQVASRKTVQQIDVI
jgi:hypothetical protein